MDLGVFVRAVCGESHTYGSEAGLLYTCNVVLRPTHPICSMIYGYTRATHFYQLAKILTGYEITGARSSGIFMGILFIVVGSLFKITAVPFRAALGEECYEGVAGAHIVFSGLCFLAAIWHWAYWDLEIFFDERIEKPSLDLPKIFGIHLFLSEVDGFGFGVFHVTGMYGPAIWVSDPYGLMGKVQPVNPAWGVEGFDSFIPGGIASHHIAAGTLGILAGDEMGLHLEIGSYIERVTGFKKALLGPRLQEAERLKKESSPSTDEEKKEMSLVPYSYAVGSLMYAMDGPVAPGKRIEEAFDYFMHAPLGSGRGGRIRLVVRDWARDRGFNNSRSLHFFLAAWPAVGIWFTALGISTMAFNLNGFNFNQSVVDNQGRVINTWVDIINRANLGMEVMHERNAHNFLLDLAAIEAPSTNG
ncbi:hypothetical protein HAX54_014959 [Datura stramonium]|uniref:Uncharacterized protein n=1 Tax=Datura stramonium TaxID=4076 RepID=A0ABS8TPV9_DATST|nr:hypothetical protein [Datura stramonium]